MAANSQNDPPITLGGFDMSSYFAGGFGIPGDRRSKTEETDESLTGKYAGPLNRIGQRVIQKNWLMQENLKPLYDNYIYNSICLIDTRLQLEHTIVSIQTLYLIP